MSDADTHRTLAEVEAEALLSDLRKALDAGSIQPEDVETVLAAYGFRKAS